MGRRKIEIQPITHERNRSVTFQKRKNGLFKKAYELGVLCSVDVAVILFEQRPGHQPKLYQYTSSDIQEIIQRHIQHDGERDTRGPGDFSGGAAGGRHDDDDGDEGEGEADDDIDDGPPSPVLGRGSKRRANGQLKQIATMPVPPPEIDYRLSALPPYVHPGLPPPGYSHSSPAPFGLPPPHIHHHHPQHAPQQLPISSDRLRPIQHGEPQGKRPRLGVAIGQRPPSGHFGEGNRPALASPVDSGHRGAGAYSYHPPGPSPSGYPAPYTQFFASTPTDAPPPHAPPAVGPSQFVPIQPPSEFSFPPPPPPPSSIVPHIHTTRSKRDPGGSVPAFRPPPSPADLAVHPRGFTSDGGSGNGPPAGAASGSGMYNSAPGASSAAGSGDILTAFLESSGRRQENGSGGRSEGGLDWPVHEPRSGSNVDNASGGSASANASPSNVSTSTSNGGATAGVVEESGSGGANPPGGWLDYLSKVTGANPATTTGVMHSVPVPAAPGSAKENVETPKEDMQPTAASPMVSVATIQTTAVGGEGQENQDVSNEGESGSGGEMRASDGILGKGGDENKRIVADEVVNNGAPDKNKTDEADA